MGGRCLSDTQPRMLGFHSAGQLTLDRCYIRAPGAECGLHPPQPGQSCQHQKGGQRAKVHEGVDTTPISAAEKVSLGFHLFPPKAPNTLAEASAWICALKREV